jgi:hypothetical protein
VGVQEIIRDKGGGNQHRELKFFNGKGNKNNELRANFLVHKRIVLAVNRPEFIGDKMKVQDPTEDKIDDTKGSFYEKLERIFDKHPKGHVKIFLGDFNRKWRIINTQKSYCQKYNFPTSLHL